MTPIPAESPLPRQQSAPPGAGVREQRIRQFLSMWHTTKNVKNDRLAFADEVQYALQELDETRREAHPLLRGGEIAGQLRGREEGAAGGSLDGTGGCAWTGGGAGINGAPSVPFGGYTCSLTQIEDNMRLRRARLLSALRPGEIATTVAGFASVDGATDNVQPCGLQVTLQAADAEQCRLLYDQLATLVPILAALTAATPIGDGRYPAASDTQRSGAVAVGSQSQSEGPSSKACGTIPFYISSYANDSESTLNDLPCEVDVAAFDALLAGGVDAPLARHLAHSLAGVQVGESVPADQFEAMMSGCAHTMRLRAPVSDPKSDAPSAGWRAEFRAMDAQVTDFENAAFVAFVVLLSRAILVFKLDFLVPLSKVAENMRRARTTDAARTGKFWFKREVVPSGDFGSDDSDDVSTAEDDFEEMTMSEIMTGKGSFVGLVPICYAYLDYIRCEATPFLQMDGYLSLIRRRAIGELLTPAAWMHRLALSSAEFCDGAAVASGVAYDVARACHDVGRGERACPELLGHVTIRPIAQDAAYDTALRGGAKEKIPIASLLAKLRRCAPEDCPVTPRTKRARYSMLIHA